MVTFSAEQVTPHVKRISDGSDVCEYLVEGDTGALLIDTGYGIGDLRGFIESIVSTPYEVMCTHGHVDHAPGVGQFDAAYLHVDDFDLYLRHADEALRRAHLDSFPDHQEEVTANGMVPPCPEVLKPLDPEHVFDLGGVHVHLIAVPGHTAGMVVPIVEEDRLVNFGDACGVGTLLNLDESTTIERYLDSLRNLAAHEDEWEIVVRQHGTCSSTKAILHDNIELCEQILAGTDARQQIESHGRTAYAAAQMDETTGARTDGREGNIFYAIEKIR